MKNNLWKPLAGWGILCGVVMLCFAGCGQSVPTMEPQEAGQWIEAFTPERIFRNDSIRVDFREEFGSREDLAEDPAALLQFSPKLKGSASWSEDGRTLWFTPEENALKCGKKYTCRVAMARLVQVDSLLDFAFSFSVRKAEVALSQCRTERVSGMTVNIHGHLRFSEPVQADRLDRSMFRVAGNVPDSVHLIRLTDDHYRFVIPDVACLSSARKVNVAFDGKALDFENVDRCVVEIPAITTRFTVMSIEQVESEEDEEDSGEVCIEIHFSRALDPNQDLTGLIEVVGVPSARPVRASSGASQTVQIRCTERSGSRYEVRVASGVRAIDGEVLSEEFVQVITVQTELAPKVRIPMTGTILPDSTHLTLPFRAVNLAAVDVRVVKIYADNVLSFLQYNELSSDHEMRRFGRLIEHRTVRLDTDPKLDLHRWQNFSIDLKGLFRREKGVIYRVIISFRQDYSLYGFTGNSRSLKFPIVTKVSPEEEEEWNEKETYRYSSLAVDDWDWDLYEWQDRDDPTKPSYYMNSNNFAMRNVMASNLGLVAKSNGEGRWWTSVTDICTTRPVAGATVRARNFQLQTIGSGVTDAHGFADFEVKGKPYMITAETESSLTYLKVPSGYEKSLSRFDVGGKRVSNGLKGFVYGERGVWRPGDTVHLTLLVADRTRRFPDKHPATMEITTPQGQFYTRQTIERGKDGFYAFTFSTNEDSPTGAWKAHFTVGGAQFDHTVPIETIKPNRLKIQTKVSDKMLSAGQQTRFNIEAHWLAGSPAKKLKTDVEMILRRKDQPFPAWNQYTFDNPLSEFTGESLSIGQCTLDSCGRGSITAELPAAEDAPGMMRAQVTTRVFEAGGDTNISAVAMDYSPYSSYVGVNLGSKYLETDTRYELPVVTVSPEGRELTGRELTYKIYRLQWQWWWEYNASQLGDYVQSTSADLYDQGELTSGKNCHIPILLKYPDYGKFLVLVEDSESGHCSGGIIYVDWPLWRGHSEKGDPDAISMLSFSLDKSSCKVGESVTVYLPAAQGGRALISIENSSRVLSRQWVCTSAKETAYPIPVTAAMAPNFYVHVTLLQPHQNTANDLPLRMYGVRPVKVIDPTTVLTPIVEHPQTVRPQQSFTIKVREKQKRAMTYTLAIVDEGLLDITAFRTPDPWAEMNRREALGIATWDMYDDVAGAVAGKFSKVLSLGGDEALRAAASKEKRYRPVVQFLGPFTLPAGGSKKHTITLPMYIGSLRVMVVAAHEGAYGKSESIIGVRSPLMVIPTLPRRMSCGDRVSLPVNIFASEAVGATELTVTVDGPVQVVGSPKRTLQISEPCDLLEHFSLSCSPNREGMAHVTVSAKGGEEHYSETIAIQVTNPQPSILESQSKMIAGSESGTFSWKRADSVRMEISTFPSMDFSGGFTFVQNYAHFCSEQLSARGFYLLYARRFLDQKHQRSAEIALRKILSELRSRQLSNGGFVYWPGNRSPHEWVSSMAGQLFVEARNQGFDVPKSVISMWVTYQQTEVRSYRHQPKAPADLQQAYRLYTLALAHKQDLAAMNRLRESGSLSAEGRRRLAAAYAVAGKRDVACALLENMPEKMPEATKWNTFPSKLRDQAMWLESEVLAGRGVQALEIAEKVADKFSAARCSTQELAFTSLAVSRLAEVADHEGNVCITPRNGSPIQLSSIRGVHTEELDPASGEVKVENKSQATLCVRLSHTYQPAVTDTVAAIKRGVRLTVKYTDLSNQPLDISKLKQGTEGYVKIHVKEDHGLDSEHMALTFRLPAGWEVWNDRMAGMDDTSCTYKDIRDDRVSWYFSWNSWRERDFTLRFRAAYEGRYILPAVVCEEMYDSNRYASTSNRIVEVVR